MIFKIQQGDGKFIGIFQIFGTCTELFRQRTACVSLTEKILNSKDFEVMSTNKFIFLDKNKCHVFVDIYLVGIGSRFPGGIKLILQITHLLELSSTTICSKFLLRHVVRNNIKTTNFLLSNVVSLCYNYLLVIPITICNFYEKCSNYEL